MKSQYWEIGPWGSYMQRMASLYELCMWTLPTSTLVPLSVTQEPKLCMPQWRLESDRYLRLSIVRPGHVSISNILPWNLGQNATIFIKGIIFENVVSKMAALLSWTHWDASDGCYIGESRDYLIPTSDQPASIIPQFLGIIVALVAAGLTKVEAFQWMICSRSLVTCKWSVRCPYT